MSITITTANGVTTLETPYNPDLPGRAKAIGGKWNGAARAWQFDARDEARVRDLARTIFGTDGDTATDTVTVRIFLDRLGEDPTLWWAGRKIASRGDRDWDVRLADGVILIEGGFAGSAGSKKHPELGARAGTILEVRDVPRAAVQAEAADTYELVNEQGPDVDALLAERERLLARLAEIDAQLPEPEGTEQTTREAAQALGVSVRTVQRWASSGKVDARKDERGRWAITITLAG